MMLLSEGEGRVYCCDVADKEWKGECGESLLL